MAKRKKRASAAHPVRRRKSTTAVAPRRRRKKSSGLGAGLMAPLKNMMNAGIGGAIYGVGAPMVAAAPMTRGLMGLAAAFVLGYLNFPVMGNGLAGAAASEIVRGGLNLGDEDLQEANYTDVDLSGQDLATDEQGNVYALGDGNQEPIYMGNINDGSFDLSANGFDLSANGFDLSEYSGEQSVMMIPSYAG